MKDQHDKVIIKKQKWIRTKLRGDIFFSYICSICKWNNSYTKSFKYCPNCGVKNVG